MGGDSTRAAIERLCAFLPSDVRRRILGLLLENDGDEIRLAGEVGCSLSSLHEWTKGNGHAPGDKYMPAILSLAVARCPGVGDLLEKELLEAVECLCADLGISQEGGKEDLSHLIDALDEKCREILWHLWWHGHAQLDELSDLIGASTHMEVLSRLREVINPTAERILGEPIVEFYESRFDPDTGEKVLFNWWLRHDAPILRRAGHLTQDAKAGQPLTGGMGGPLMDLFDENDHVVIIAQLPSSVAVSNDADVACRNGILRIRLGKA